jgi:hypothetical protein
MVLLLVNNRVSQKVPHASLFEKQHHSLFLQAELSGCRGCRPGKTGCAFHKAGLFRTITSTDTPFQH